MSNRWSRFGGLLKDEVSSTLGVPRSYVFRAKGAASLSSLGQRPKLLQYVEMQQEHHRTRTFQEEYRELLRRHGVNFDERYVWD